MQSTVCVEAGVYSEELRVPPFVHLLGEGTGSVRIRPPDSRWVPHSAFVDRILLTLEPTEDGPVRVEGVDVGGAAICADLVGAGTAFLKDVTLDGCGVGVRGSAGSLLIEGATIRRNFLWGLHLVDLDSATIRASTAIVDNGHGSLPAPLRPEFSGDWERAAELDLLSAGGAIRASGVGELVLDGVEIDRNAYEDAAVALDATDWTIRDSTMSVGHVVVHDEVGLAGEGPAVLVAGGVGSIVRTEVTSSGQGLVHVRGDPADLYLDSVAWRVDPDETLPAPGDPGPSIDLDAGGSLVARHLTLLGDGATPGITLGGESVALDVANTIAWGHPQGQGLVANGAEVTGPGIRFSLFEDNDVEGEDMLPTNDPDLGEGDDPIEPPSLSIARCTGTSNLTTDTDLRGEPRPFEAGKAPDLGAIERQEACP